MSDERNASRSSLLIARCALLPTVWCISTEPRRDGQKRNISQIALSRKPRHCPPILANAQNEDARAIPTRTPPPAAPSAQYFLPREHPLSTPTSAWRSGH